MSITDQEVIGLLRNNQYLDAVKLYERKYGVPMREALAVIRPLWRELRKERSAVRPSRYSKPDLTSEKTVKANDFSDEHPLEDLQEMAEEVLEDAGVDHLEPLDDGPSSEEIELEIEPTVPPPPPEPTASKHDALIRDLMEQGNMEGAAKAYEEAYGVSITEAINQVFQLRHQMEKQEPAPESEQDDYQSGQTYAISPEIIELVKSGRKLEAVKRFREIYNTSLKDSKHFIDEIATRL